MRRYASLALVLVLGVTLGFGGEGMARRRKKRTVIRPIVATKAHEIIVTPTVLARAGGLELELVCTNGAVANEVAQLQIDTSEDSTAVSYDGSTTTLNAAGAPIDIATIDAIPPVTRSFDATEGASALTPSGDYLAFDLDTAWLTVKDPNGHCSVRGTAVTHDQR
jgi:hypothetical protein